MNSPPLKPEQLSPTMSPMAFSLDDPSNGNGFSHLLASPTKLKLDSGCGGPNMNNNGGSNGHSLIYRTSLSKLSELSRTGRSRQRSNSDTLRSSSPIRFQLFSNGPKMLKPEYMSQQPSTLPLLSTLMKQSATGLASNSNKEANNQADIATRAGIRETLKRYQDEQLQLSKQTDESKQQRQVDIKVEQRPKVPEPKSQLVPERNISESASAISGMTLCDKQRDPDETIKAKATTLKSNEEDVRVISSSSLVSSAVSIDFNNLPKELDLDALASDKNGFVHSDEFKRCSFISSTSTDYDADWYNNQPVITHEETAKLDHRIKQLELEIEEMKLQNEKLIQSITTSRTVEDMFVFDAINEIKSSRQEAQRGVQRKVMQLEKKVENYRKVMKTLGDSPVKKAAPKDKRSSYPMGENPQIITLRKRISRISSTELRQIEEQGSSSSSDDEKETQQHRPNHDDTPPLRPRQDASALSFRRKAGLQLHIQVEPLGES